MATRIREHGPMLLLGAIGVLVMTHLGLYGFGWNDYATESLPAQDALTSGHLWQFLTLAPGYGGSLELRAPFALLGSLWGGGEVAVYRAVSIPCLAVAALFGVWLAGEMRAQGQGLLARTTALGLCVAGPVVLPALQFGHAEDILGAVLCIAAVLAAERRRSVACAVLLGLAIANKEWAVLATGPVLLVLPAADRRRALAIAAAIAACFYVPLLLPALVNHARAPVVVTGGSIVQPWQLWWFLGDHIQIAHRSFGIDPFNPTTVITERLRTPPAWVQTWCHPLIAAVGVPATLLAARRGARDPLLLLALLFVLRCALDTWDTLYYPLPFILTLLTWEVLRRRRAPVLALTASALVWLIYSVAPGRTSADGLAALFTLAVVPTIVALGLALYAPGAVVRRRSSGAGATPIPTM